VDGGGNDISQDDLMNLASAPVLAHSATELKFNLGGGIHLTMDGTGFGGFDANGVPTTGTVTSFQVTDSGTLDTKFANFSIAFSTLWGFVKEGDVTSFQNALFAGDDSFLSKNALASDDGADNLSGFGGNDSFNMTNAVAGAFATIGGGAGNDVVRYGGNYNPAHDAIDGGAGSDKLFLTGNYSVGITLAALTSVEQIVLGAQHNYTLTSIDANVAEGAVLTINGYAVGGSVAAEAGAGTQAVQPIGTSVNFNGSAETDGRFVLDGGTANDVFTGGANSDTFNLNEGGSDIAHGNGGNDVFSMGATFDPFDQIDGGAGKDTIKLDGDYSAGITLAANTMFAVETLTVAAGHNYNLTTNNGNVASGGTLTVDASALSGANTLTFNGQAETDGKFVIVGGAGHDTLTGGTGNDKITGGTAADHINGGGGNDTFIYLHNSDSLGSANGGPAGSGFDTIAALNFAHIHFDLWFTVASVSAEVVGGNLQQPLFDTNLGTALNSSHLAAHGAVLFAPSSGDYNGHLFLVVEVNGTAGYQSGDLVFDVTGAANLSHLTAATFI
jgi:Ca2+-binding RTX toxin-like protein